MSAIEPGMDGAGIDILASPIVASLRRMVISSITSGISKSISKFFLKYGTMICSFSFLYFCEIADGVIPICAAISFDLNPCNNSMSIISRSCLSSGAWSHTSSTIRLNCNRRSLVTSNDIR